MEHGELLRQDGSVEMANIAIYAHPVGDAVFQTDIYTLKGGDEYEEFTPRFHYNGFQYVTVRADRPIELDESSLTAHFIHTDVESIGTFESSNEMWNKLWRAVRRSYLSNLYGIPTDCPQREKNGWTADAHISIDIALTNYDAILAYEKWIDDIIDNQREDGSISGVIPGTAWGFADWIGPVWDAVMFIIPDALYNYYGDESSIRRIYPTCQRYLEYLRGRENEEGVIAYGLSDWCFWQTQTPNDYTAAAFYYYDNTLMARFAKILGKREDAERYAKKAKELQKYINNKFLDAETCVYSIGKITAQALPLALGFAPENLREKVAARLNEAVVESGYVCDFGLLGSKYTLRMLVDYGYVDTAYRLATQTKRPSWGNWIESGFTTPLETWAIRDTFRDSSANHVFFGDIVAWMHSHVAGIQYDRDKPGFSHIIIRPAFPEGLEWAKASYKSVRGEIASSWRRHGDKVTLQVLVPLNTTATVYLDQKYEIKGTGTPITLVGNAVKSK
jgi:alpha-L-rhamnosidase